MIARISIRALVFLLATVFTQIGGLAYLATLALRARMPSAWCKGPIGAGLLFLSFYAAASATANLAAPAFGRVPIPCFGADPGRVEVHSMLFCVLNRHFVSPDVLQIADNLATHMEQTYPGAKLQALDAGFPFFDWFPMLPHLSHRDGRALDLALFYRNENGEYSPGATKSPIGYWGFEQPRPGDPEPCKGRSDWLTLRWDMTWLQPLLKERRLDNARTAAAVRWLAREGASRGVSKIFVEPHLRRRLGVRGDAIRFQGCRAARHDDHIHFQVK